MSRRWPLPVAFTLVATAGGADFWRARSGFHTAEKACWSGSKEACEAAAGKLLDGTRWISADRPRAAALLSNGCERGCGSCCARLGDHVGAGTLGSDLIPEAGALHRRGCELDSPTACAALCTNSKATGIDGEGDLRDTVFYCGRACALGQPEGCERERELEGVLRILEETKREIDARAEPEADDEGFEAEDPPDDHGDPVVEN
jgi:TPR repeat protein